MTGASEATGNVTGANEATGNVTGRAEATGNLTGASEATGNLTGSGNNRPPLHAPTKFTELVGIEYPIVQTGMGCYQDHRSPGHVERRRFGDLASATMTFGELEAAIKKTSRSPTNRSGTCAPTPPMPPTGSTW